MEKFLLSAVVKQIPDSTKQPGKSETKSVMVLSVTEVKKKINKIIKDLFPSVAQKRGR